MGCTYIWLLNGIPVYNGWTSKSLETRTWEHYKSAMKDRGGILGAAIRKYGLEAFEVVPQLICNDHDTLREYEVYSIRYLSTRFPYGYNIHPGGNGGYRGNKKLENKALKVVEKNVYVRSNNARAAAYKDMREEFSTRQTKELKPEKEVNWPIGATGPDLSIEELADRIAELEKILGL